MKRANAGRRLPGSVRKALWIAGFVVGLPGVIWLILYAIGSWQLSRALASAREAGLATSLAGLAPPSPPPDRNAAALYEAAFALHPGPEDPVLRRVCDQEFPRVFGDDEPRVRLLLEKSAALFEKVRAARALGACRYDRDYAGGIFNAAPSQGAPALRTASLLALQAQIELGSNPEAARETLRDLLALADSFRSEPLIISQLIRSSIQSGALEVIHGAVTRETGREELRAWRDVVPRPETWDGACPLVLRGEFAMGAELAGRPLSEALAAADPSQTSPSWLARTRLLAPYWKLVGSNYVERMTRVVEAGGKPFPEAHAALEAEGEQLRSSKPRGDLLSVMLIPSLERVLAGLALSQARLAVLRSGLEWEIARSETGRYPDEVATLDPLSGRPLRYDRNAGSLSSAGIPGRDAGQLVWKLRHPPGK